MTQISKPKTGSWVSPVYLKEGTGQAFCELAWCLDGKQKDLGSIRFGSPFSYLQKMWFMDTVL